MPPRKVKKDPEVTNVADGLEEPLKELIVQLRDNILEAARRTAKEEADRVLSTIPKKYHDMPLMELLNMSDVPFDFLGTLSKTTEEEESENEQEEVNENNEEGGSKENRQEPEDEMEIDDAAHETSIPIAPSGQNSGRNTAADAHRNEIITPAGSVIPVPTLNPFKPFRTVHANEEFAFSVNGSPLVLAGLAAANKKKSVKKSNTKKKTTAEAGLLVPKEENLGTSV